MSVAKLAVAGATVVSSSALWQAFGEGTMPIETAATRFGIVLVVSWIALTLVAELVLPEQAATPDLAAAETPPPDAEGLADDQPSPVPPTSMPNP